MLELDWLGGKIAGEGVLRLSRKIRDLEDVFEDHAAWASMGPDTLVYSVEWTQPTAQDTEGGLFWGVTVIEPGRVGEEFFMTRGHFHAKRDRGEYYTTAQGTGILLLMDESRSGRSEQMTSGSLHYIPGHTAHRVVNTGQDPLIFWACWPSDAGHDYGTLQREGFSHRVVAGESSPRLVPSLQL